MQLTKNFHLKEFKCKCGCNNHLKYLENIKELANNLQIIRDKVNSAIIINSGFRCINHNRSIGGAKHSLHLLGKAVDFNIKNTIPFITYRITYFNMKNNYIKAGGLKQYVTFVHYDIRGKYTTW